MEEVGLRRPWGQICLCNSGVAVDDFVSAPVKCALVDRACAGIEKFCGEDSAETRSEETRAEKSAAEFRHANRFQAGRWVIARIRSIHQQ